MQYITRKRIWLLTMPRLIDAYIPGSVRCYRTRVIFESQLIDRESRTSVHVRLLIWRSIASGAAALLLLCSTACTNKSRSWTEEVRLASGDIVRVERMHRYEVKGAWSGPQFEMPIETRLRVMGHSAEWVGRLDPILLTRDPATGDYVLVGATTVHEVWEQYGKNKPPYWQFRLHDNRWTEEPIKSWLFGMKTNLLLSPSWVEDSKHLVTLEKKQAWTYKYAHGLISRYETILPDADNHSN